MTWQSADVRVRGDIMARVTEENGTATKIKRK